MTTSPAIVLEPRPHPGECQVCEIELAARLEPGFAVRIDSGELCPDCFDAIDPARAAALRILNRVNAARARLRPGPATVAYFDALGAGLRAVREDARRA